MGKRIRSLLWLQIHALVKCCFVGLWSTQCDQVQWWRGVEGVVLFGPILQSVLCFKVGLPRVLIVCVVRSRERIVD